MRLSLASTSPQFKKLLLLDATGALTTALLLSQVLARWEEFFGMPVKVLIFLSSIAVAYAIFSFSSAVFSLSKKWLSLKVIAVANFLYCGLSLGLVLWYYQELSLYGLLYFAGEILIIASLATYEWTVAARRNT